MELAFVATAVREISNYIDDVFAVGTVEGHLDFGLALCRLADRLALMDCSMGFDSPDRIIPWLMGCCCRKAVEEFVNMGFGCYSRE